MDRYAYSLNAGRAFNLRYVSADYELQPGEIEGHGVPLPSIDSLSITPQAEPYSATLDMGGDIKEVIGR